MPSLVMIEKPGNRLALEALGGAASCRDRFSDPVDFEVLRVSWEDVVEDAAIDGIDE
jgi:hypothetical protein